MRLVLAPMEGVIDYLMRQLLSDINQYDLCVTEFVRVVDSLMPARVFYRFCPELHQQGLTRSGSPVRVQLLGQDPQCLAENAARAIELGSHGIDLNFGCPSKVVNGNKGGAALLKEPDIIFHIIRQVRTAVDDKHEVSAKIRLGWDNSDNAIDIALAAQDAGASSLAVHGRTKADGYRAEAINWPAIQKIQQRLTIPVVANGEIWSVEDAITCQQITGCETLMLGRGALALPNLGGAIKGLSPVYSWQQTLALLMQYCRLELAGDKGMYFPNRMKQWLNFLRRQYPQAADFFLQIRQLQTAEAIIEQLDLAIKAQPRACESR